MKKRIKKAAALEEVFVVFKKTKFSIKFQIYGISIIKPSGQGNGFFSIHFSEISYP